MKFEYSSICFFVGWDHRKQAQVEDHESPDRSAEGGDSNQRSCPRQGTAGAPKSGKRKGNPQGKRIVILFLLVKLKGLDDAQEK